MRERRPERTGPAVSEVDAAFHEGEEEEYGLGNAKTRRQVAMVVVSAYWGERSYGGGLWRAGE